MYLVYINIDLCNKLSSTPSCLRTNKGYHVYMYIYIDIHIILSMYVYIYIYILIMDY
jgi:hypothetical protein